MTLIIIGTLAAVLLVTKIYFEQSGSRFEKMIEKTYNTLNKPTAPIEHKMLSCDGYEVHYYVSGNSDSELIVFLHPAFSDHKAFDPQIDEFSHNYRVVTVDMIGHGLSAAHKSGDKIDVTPDHINRIVESEGYNKAHFIGVSMGSLIAQYFAVKNPDKVSSLTILGGYDINKVDGEVAKAQNASNLGLIIKALFSIKAFRAAATPITAYTLSGQAWFYESMKQYTRKSFIVMSGLGNIIKDRDFNPSYPILVLCGEHDIPLAKEMAKKLHESISGSEYNILQGAGHCANMDMPQGFNEILLSFIEAHHMVAN